MSDAGNKAVFLSYALRDAEAARRVAGALRVAGVDPRWTPFVKRVGLSDEQLK